MNGLREIWVDVRNRDRLRLAERGSAVSTWLKTAVFLGECLLLEELLEQTMVVVPVQSWL